MEEGDAVLFFAKWWFFVVAFEGSGAEGDAVPQAVFRVHRKNREKGLDKAESLGRGKGKPFPLRFFRYSVLA